MCYILSQEKSMTNTALFFAHAAKPRSGGKYVWCINCIVETSYAQALRRIHRYMGFRREINNIWFFLRPGYYSATGEPIQRWWLGL